MKKILTALTITGLALALSAGVFAQGAGPQGGLKTGKQEGQGKQGKGGGRMGMMRGKAMQEVYAKLNLSADQKKRMEALQKSTGDKIKALMEKAGQNADRKAMREQFKPIMEAHQKAVKEILTPEQEKKLEVLMKEMREKRMKERGGAGAPGTAKRVKPGGGTAGGSTKTKGGGL